VTSLPASKRTPLLLLSLGPREGNWHENGEKLRTMNFISRALHQILYRLWNQGEWDGRVMWNVGEIRECILYLGEDSWSIGANWIPERTYRYNIKVDFKEIQYISFDWVNLAWDMDKKRTLVNIVLNLRVPFNVGNFLTTWGNAEVLTSDSSSSVSHKVHVIEILDEWRPI